MVLRRQTTDYTALGGCYLLLFLEHAQQHLMVWYYYLQYYNVVECDTRLAQARARSWLDASDPKDGLKSSRYSLALRIV